MKIYTKSGDAGETSLLGGTRVPKFDIRIEAYGTIDELNAYLGHLSDQEIVASHKTIIQNIQYNLFSIGAILANDQKKSAIKLPEIHHSDVELLEKSIDQMEEKLPPLKHFVLPGGHHAQSLSHIVRCICRRAERRVVELSQKMELNPQILVYLNRLSDWLFVLSRYIIHSSNAIERTWIPKQN